MSEKRVTFPSGVITLEGLLHVPEGGCETGVVVCHPHPAYGGEMHNNVLQALVDMFDVKGRATLRFNFRGTGGSGGCHGCGIGELEDVVAAVSYLLDAGVDRVAVAGYSFGAAVGMESGMQDERVEALAGVSLPIRLMDGSFLVDCTKPKQFVVGSQDEFCTLTSVGDLFGRVPDPKRMDVVGGADHFWFGYELEAANLVAEFLDDLWASSTGGKVLPH